MGKLVRGHQEVLDEETVELKEDTSSVEYITPYQYQSLFIDALIISNKKDSSKNFRYYLRQACMK